MEVPIIKREDSVNNLPKIVNNNNDNGDGNEDNESENSSSSDPDGGKEDYENEGDDEGEEDNENAATLLQQCTTDPVAAAAAVARGAAQVGVDNALRGKKKRLCRFPGCSKVIKSQGHCQRHGAKAKRCKVEGCDKQAQGTHEGMCKRHWRTYNFPDNADSTRGGLADMVARKTNPPPPEGPSVYETILPESIGYRPTTGGPQLWPLAVSTAKNSSGAASSTKGTENITDESATSSTTPPSSRSVQVMPLVAYLREGALNKPVGWHRNAERRARGLFPLTSLATQLEPWERQLALVEILLLSGGTPHANFKDLAHAWGREKGFHHVLASSVCERRGEVERKRRSDAGKILSQEERDTFRTKMKRTRDYRTGKVSSATAPREASVAAAEESALDSDVTVAQCIPVPASVLNMDISNTVPDPPRDHQFNTI